MENVAFTLGITLLINRYPIKLPPSLQLDFAGRIINIFQILAHFPHAIRLLMRKKDDAHIFIDSTSSEFLIINILDYIGWLAIFSRVNHIPILVKTMANMHIAAQIINMLIGYNLFVQIFISSSNIYLWDLYKGLFILADPMVRGYYHFIVLKNY